MRKIEEPKIKRLLISHNLFAAGRTFFEIFLSIYIWKLTNDIKMVAGFYISYLFFHTVFFTVFAPIVKKSRFHFARRLSLLGFIVIYTAMYMLGEGVVHHAILLGVIIGVFNGMYWIGYQTVRFDLTTTTNRGNFTGLENAGKIIVGIVMPVLGGYIITANYFGLAYSNLFLFGTLFFVASFVVGNIDLPVHKTSQFHFRKSWKLIWSNVDIRKSMFGYVLSGIGYNGAVTRTLLPLLIFDQLQNEFDLGGWLSFFSLVSIFLSITVGRYVNYNYYRVMLTISGILMFCSISSLVIFPVFLTFILFGIAKEIVTVFGKIPKRVISENLVNTIPDYNNHRVEYFVIREWFAIVFGMMMGYVLLLFVDGLSLTDMKYIILFMASMNLFEVILLRSIKTNIKKV